MNADLSAKIQRQLQAALWHIEQAFAATGDEWVEDVSHVMAHLDAAAMLCQP